MTEPFLASILLFSGNFAPKGWAFCHGQILPIMQNQALYSLLGTTYGGDGRTTFALPDLRDRTIVGAGAGVEITPKALGEKSDYPAAASGETVLRTGASNYIIALQGIFPMHT